MSTQRPPEKTVTEILESLKKREQESDEIELDFFQKQQLWAERHIRRIMARIRQRDTGEVTQVAPQTPPAFQMSPELQQERQRVSDSLNQPRHATHSDPPTQQLNNPADVARISAIETVIMALPDTGNIPLGPVRLTTFDTPPRESFYTSDEALVLLIDHAVKSHERKYNGIAPDVIEMPEEVFNLLVGRIDMTEYVTANRHIPFAINTALPTTTITNTVKCITH